MNVLDGISSGVKLALSFVALVLVGFVLWWASTFVTAKATLEEYDRADAAIAKGNKSANAAAKARDAADKAFYTANTTQATALANELTHEDAVFDDRARAEYFRVLNAALRGPER